MEASVLVPDFEGQAHFGLGELGFQERPQHLQLERNSTILRLDEGLRRLAAILVAEPVTATSLDRWVAMYRLLEHARVDVVTDAQQHILGTVDDEHKAVLVQIANVTGHQQS